MQDTPVFLPVKSPTVPFRLVSSELTGAAPGAAGVTVCVLCGPSPSLVEIETGRQFNSIKITLDNFWFLGKFFGRFLMQGSPDNMTIGSSYIVKIVG